jgi:sugar phosphate isomerase/epimerase
MTRREFGAWALAATAAPLFAKRIDSTVSGIRIGVQSYSFRDRPLDQAIQAMASIGIGICELWQGHVEPRLPEAYGTAESREKREALRKWRTEVPLDHFRQIARRFNDAGIEIHAYDYSFRDDFSDAEVTRGFEMAKALGAKTMVASSTITMAKRIDAEAARAGIRVAMHGHSKVDDPNEFSDERSFEKALGQCSPSIGVALDIGHFIAAGGDPVRFLEKHHARVYTTHIKDRKKNQGPNMPWGQGDTPVREILLALKARQYPLPAEIEYAYPGNDTVSEVRKCFQYCRDILSGKS